MKGFDLGSVFEIVVGVVIGSIVYDKIRGYIP